MRTLRRCCSPIWARFYQIRTDRPIFADRDKTIHDRVSELSRERRNGFAWDNSEPRQALERFAEWQKIRQQRGPANPAPPLAFPRRL